MELKKELKKLKQLFENKDVAGFKKQYESIKNNFKTEKEIAEIDKFMQAVVDNSMSETEDRMKQIRLQFILQQNKEIIPLSYIAEKYFGKQKQWLYQRINGNIVNGMPAKFTQEEIDKFNFALKDISEKLGSIYIS